MPNSSSKTSVVSNLIAAGYNVGNNTVLKAKDYDGIYIFFLFFFIFFLIFSLLFYFNLLFFINFINFLLYFIF